MKVLNWMSLADETRGARAAEGNGRAGLVQDVNARISAEIEDQEQDQDQDDERPAIEDSHEGRGAKSFKKRVDTVEVVPYLHFPVNSGRER